MFIVKVRNLFVVYSVALSTAWTVWYRVIGWLIYNELETEFMEAPCFQTPSMCVPPLECETKYCIGINHT